MNIIHPLANDESEIDAATVGDVSSDTTAPTPLPMGAVVGADSEAVDETIANPSALRLDVASIPATPGIPKKPDPFIKINSDGSWQLLREPDPETDFSPEAREIYGDDWMGAVRFMASAPEGQRADYERFILREVEAAREMGGPELPEFSLAIKDMYGGENRHDRG